MGCGLLRCSPRPRRLDPRAAIVAIVTCLFAPAQAEEPRRVPGRLILKLEERVDTSKFQRKANGSVRTQLAELEALHESFATERFVQEFPLPSSRRSAPGEPDLSRFYILEFAPELELERVRAAYQELDVVEIAAFDYVVPLHLETNDFNSQWHLESQTGRDAHVTGGWNHSLGDSNVVLAILDSGVDWMHPDLGGSGPNYTDGNIAINWDEYFGEPLVDDDDNGWTDDVRGWDFVTDFRDEIPVPGEDSGSADNDPMDFDGHGTHVAGIAGAITDNGLGVAGVGFGCKILPLRVGGAVVREGAEVGLVWMSFAARAILYATQYGVSAINCSWGSVWTPDLDAAVDAAVANGVVVVTSAGNDNNRFPSYLSSRGDCFDVAASSLEDRKASFSNYGDWVDVTAPGVSIYSTDFDHNVTGGGRHTYRTRNGTSMAAPVVTGLVGLVRARWPLASRAEIQQRIRNGANDIDDLNPTYAGLLGAGRVNALRTFGDRFLTVPDDYPSFRKALAASSPGDTVALIGGTRHVAELLISQNDRLVQGGWNADFKSRDPDNTTIVEGSGAAPVLRFLPGTGSTLVLESLHVSGGVALQLSTPPGMYGGGMVAIDASPVFLGCTFEGNTAGGPFEVGGGAGAFLMNSSARFVDCTFTGNVARQGSGVYALDSDLEFERCVFAGNSTFDTGDARGSGMTVRGGSLLVVGGRFESNEGAHAGGGVYASGAQVEIRDTHFVDNSAAVGGAIALADQSTLDLASAIVHRNRATHLGGGMHTVMSTGTITNTTFDANSGAVAALYLSTPPSPWGVRNCIFSNHTSGGPAVIVPVDTELDYNLYWNNPNGDILGASHGPNSVHADPRFVDPSAGDLALGVHSPALDSGDPDARFADRDGTRNDRGAFGGPHATSGAPSPPMDLRAVTTGDGVELSWVLVGEMDLDFVAIYRDSDSTFVPSPSNFVAGVEAAQPMFLDTEGTAGGWYRIAAVDTRGASSGFDGVARAEPPTGVEDPGDGTTSPTASPAFHILHPNEPNPFNPVTRIRFDLPHSSHVRVEILDGRGRLVRRLTERFVQAGTTVVFWDGTDDAGRAMPSGIYLYRIAAGRWVAARKMTLLR